MKINFPTVTTTPFGDLPIGTFFIDDEDLYAKSPTVYSKDGGRIGNALVIASLPNDALYSAYVTFSDDYGVIPIREITLAT